MSTTVIVFLDTNAFIHLQSPEYLNWRELFPGVDQVDVIVARTVLKELENHKVGDRDRLRNRARQVLDTIKKAIGAPGHDFVVRPADPQVRLVVPRIKIEWDGLDELDQSEPDDRLVAEAVSFGSGAIILSGDSDVHASAHAVNAPVLEPPEAWQLPPVASDKDREISTLKARVAAAERTKPAIDVEFEASSIHAPVPVLAQLDSFKIHRCLEKYQEHYPPELKRGGMFLSAGPRGEEAKRRRETYWSNYAAFEELLRAYFEQLHTKLMKRARCVRLPFVVRNDSEVAATDLRIKTVIQGGWLLTAVDNPMVGTLRRLVSPAPPVFKPESSLYVIEKPAGPDPESFAWVGTAGKPDAPTVRLCKSFTPKRRYPTEEICWVRDALPASGPHKVKLTQFITGYDLPEPMERHVDITMAEKQARIEDEWVLDLLPEAIRAVIRAALTPQ